MSPTCPPLSAAACGQRGSPWVAGVTQDGYSSVQRLTNKPTNEQRDESGKDSEVMLKRRLKVMITGIAMQELRRLCFMQ